MRRLMIIIILACCSACFCTWAQQADARNTLSPENKEKWLNEMRKHKHDFLAKELELSKEQQAEFFPIYDQMDDELNRIAEETRRLETKVSKDNDASDTELEAASRALFEQKSREGAIEMAYFDKFKDILTPNQLIRLKNAERKFTQKLVRQHGRMRLGPERKQ